MLCRRPAPRQQRSKDNQSSHPVAKGATRVGRPQPWEFVMKRLSMNIALGTIFGAAVAGVIAVALAGRSWLWFGIAVGTAGGWAISKWKHFYFAFQERRARNANSVGTDVDQEFSTRPTERNRRSSK